MIDRLLILVRGLSGSGKTTLAERICEGSDSAVCISADDFFYNDDDEYVFDPEQLKEAHAWCQSETESCMVQGFETIVVHNTLTRTWECEVYINLANSNGYEVMVVNLYDAGLNDSQLSSRSEHNIPLASIRSQRKRWDSDVFRSEQPRPSVSYKSGKYQRNPRRNRY